MRSGSYLTLVKSSLFSGLPGLFVGKYLFGYEGVAAVELSVAFCEVQWSGLWQLWVTHLDFPTALILGIVNAAVNRKWKGLLYKSIPPSFGMAFGPYVTIGGGSICLLRHECAPRLCRSMSMFAVFVSRPTAVFATLCCSLLFPRQRESKVDLADIPVYRNDWLAWRQLALGGAAPSAAFGFTQHSLLIWKT